MSRYEIVSRMEDRIEQLPTIQAALELVAALTEQVELISDCKTCRACAEKRMVAAMYHYTNTEEGWSARGSQAIARDTKQNLCEKCEERAREKVDE